MIIKKIGKWTVEINADKIFITDDWVCNHGIFYRFNFEKFRDMPCNIDPDWTFPQVIAMDDNTGLTKGVKNWIYNQIRKGAI